MGQSPVPGSEAVTVKTEGRRQKGESRNQIRRCTILRRALISEAAIKVLTEHFISPTSLSKYFNPDIDLLSSPTDRLLTVVLTLLYTPALQMRPEFQKRFK